MRINEHADGIVLHGGEADERRLLNEPVDNVVTIMTHLAGGLARLTWVTSASGTLELGDLQLALPQACATLDQSRDQPG